MRALFDEATLTVYQAYAPRIADAALAAGTFVAPFALDRMTWIKPSFLWMMYRSGWGTKPDQERVLAVRVGRAGFEQALADACLSHYDPDVYADHDAWLRRKAGSPVRVQWDPERDLALRPLAWRAVQVGLSGPATRAYVSEWITGIDDVTATAHEVARLIADRDLAGATARLPVERPYPLPPAVARTVGATPTRADEPAPSPPAGT